MERSAAFNLLVRVSQELDAARFSVSIATEHWHLYIKAAKTPEGERIAHRDVLRCAENLDLTYFLRLFATFESITRDFWLRGMGRATDPPVTHLMDSVAAFRRMDPQTLSSVHVLRVLRNELMHQNVSGSPINFGRCSSVIGKYLSWLPDRW